MELSRHSLAQRMGRLALVRSRSRNDFATATPAAPAFDGALEHFAHGRWKAAFEALVPLADAGHAEAARIAGLMSLRGPRLFGQAFPASRAQRERWLVAARSDRVADA